jgi:hypothetical protein
MPVSLSLDDVRKQRVADNINKLSMRILSEEEDLAPRNGEKEHEIKILERVKNALEGASSLSSTEVRNIIRVNSEDTSWGKEGFLQEQVDNYLPEDIRIRVNVDDIYRRG